jgi:2-polyprenyl-6-methoxyphenol hydroxylase-like FAD-dependent oxidoreductase
VVGADGLRSVVARGLGAPVGPDRTGKVSLTLHVRGSGPATDRGHLVLTSDATLGLAPLGTSLWNATVVVSARERGRELAADPPGFALGLVERLAPGWTSPPALEAGPWASGTFDFRVRRIVGHGVVLVGDAAGYYDPLTGQGIYRALRSAELAAEAIDTALRLGRVSVRELAPYARRMRAELAPSRRVQRVVEAVVSRRRLRELAVGRLADVPGAMDALVRVTGDARPVGSLLRPSVWAPLLVPGSRDRGRRLQGGERRGRRGTSSHPSPAGE